MKLIVFPSAVPGFRPPAVGTRHQRMLSASSHAEQGRAAQLPQSVTKTGPMAWLLPATAPPFPPAANPVTWPNVVQATGPAPIPSHLALPLGDHQHRGGDGRRLRPQYVRTEAHRR